MSDLAYHHGVRHTVLTTGRRAIRVVATSVIGLVAMGADADAGVFPLNTPVALYDLPAAIAEAGEDGTLATALKAIDNQVKTIVVVVRVAKSTDPDAADALAENTAATIAGLDKLLLADQALGVKPRIIGAPGLDAPATVAAALATVTDKLNGFAYFDCKSSGTVAEATAYRDTFGSKRMMAVKGDFYIGEDVSWGVANALGLRAQLDQTQGIHKTISNVPVAGVTSIANPVTWDLQNPSTEAGVLNAADVTCLIRRSGLRFWGNRTCSEAPEYAFESTVRVESMIQDSIADASFIYIDQPLTPGLARTIVENVAEFGRLLVRSGVLAGFEAYLTEANTPDQLAAGKLRIGYRFTVTPPLEDLGFQAEITNDFLVDFLQLSA